MRNRSRACWATLWLAAVVVLSGLAGCDKHIREAAAGTVVAAGR